MGSLPTVGSMWCRDGNCASAGSPPGGACLRHNFCLNIGAVVTWMRIHLCTECASGLALDETELLQLAARHILPDLSSSIAHCVALPAEQRHEITVLRAPVVERRALSAMMMEWISSVSRATKIK